MKSYRAPKGMSEAPVLYPHDEVAVYLASDIDPLMDALDIAMTELNAVQDEIGIKSRGLSLLRAALSETP